MSLIIARRGMRAGSRRRSGAIVEGFVGAADPATTLPIVLRASNLKLSTGTSSSPSFTVPAEAQGGDLIVVTFGMAVTTTTYLPPTPPAGWALALPFVNRGGTAAGTLVNYWKIASGTSGQISSDAGTTVTFTGTQNRSYQAFVTVSSGSSRAPKLRSETASAGTHAIAPRLTSVPAGALVYSVIRTANTSTPTVSGDAGLTTLGQGTSASTGAATMTVVRIPQAAAGRTGLARYVFNGQFEQQTMVID